MPDLGGEGQMRLNENGEIVDPAEEAEKITFFLYEELLAFKRAAKTLGLSRQDIEDIMYNNAHDLIEGARKSIYG